MENREISYASLTVMAKLLLAFSIGGRGLHSSVSGSYLSMLLSRRVPLKPPAHKKSSHKKSGQLDLTSVIIKCLAQHQSSTVLFMRQHTNRASKSSFILKDFCGAMQINGWLSHQKRQFTLTASPSEVFNTVCWAAGSVLTLLWSPERSSWLVG